MALRVLVVDDDRRLFELLSSYLAQNDVAAVHAIDGLRGLELARTETFDAMILDVMMPGIDGLTVLSRLRESSGLPVVMLTAKGDETDRVVGLEMGADDYLAKPFSPRELLARLRAVLRRGRPHGTSDWIEVEDIRVNKVTREVTVGGESIEMTALEFDLLLALLDRPGRVVSRTSLLEFAGRGDTAVGERAVDVHVSHLRKKLKDQERSPRLIQTVRGVGYVLGRGT